MITASEARALTMDNDADIDRHLEKIGNKIEEQAKLGKRSIILSNVDYHENRYQVVEPEAFRLVVRTPFQERLYSRLTKLGFSMIIESEERDRNKGMRLGMVDDSNGPDMYTAYWITISW